MSGLDEGAAPPATLDVHAGDELAQTHDKRFLFSESGSSRPVWVLGGRQVPKLPALAVLSGALALLCLVLAVWCGSLQGQQCSGVADRSECETPGCLRQAAEIASYLNRSVEPCSDFYQFACGLFDEAHPLGTEISYGIVNVLESVNKARIEELLERTQIYNEFSAVSKAKTFYTTCMTSFHGNSSSLRLVELVNSVGGLDLFGTFDPDDWTFQETFFQTREVHRLRLFFSITWLQTLNRVMVSLPRLGLRNRAVYTADTDEARSRREVYRQSIVAVLTLVQSDLPDVAGLNRSCGDICAQKFSEDVLYVETELAKAMPKGTLVLPATRNVMSLQDLDSLAPQLKWRLLLDRLFGTGIISTSASMQVSSKEYMVSLNTLIKETNSSVLNNYIQWNLLRQYMPGMGPLYAIMEQEMQFVTSGTPTRPRQEVCFDLLRHYLPRALRAFFIRGHIGEDNVAAAKRLVVRIKKMLAESFNWMSPAARGTSRSVLNDLKVVYGHSPWVTDPRRLNEYYSDLTLSNVDFFTNLVNVDRFKASKLKANAARLGNDDDDDDDVWVDGEAADVKVVYNPVRGQLKVPVGILQVPLFSHESPDYINAAAFGSMVLAQFAGPFFLRHRTYRLPSWWDQQTTDKYRSYGMCLMDSLDGYTVRVEKGFEYKSSKQSGSHSRSEVRLDPRKSATYVQSEHLAFMLAYNLFKQISAEDGPQRTLPGIQGRTPEQLFFLAFAQSRCRHTNRFLKVLLNSAFKEFPHAEMINNFVYNSPDFMKAYQCAAAPTQHQGKHCVLQ